MREKRDGGKKSWRKEELEIEVSEKKDWRRNWVENKEKDRVDGVEDWVNKKWGEVGEINAGKMG